MGLPFGERKTGTTNRELADLANQWFSAESGFTAWESRSVSRALRREAYHQERTLDDLAPLGVFKLYYELHLGEIVLSSKSQGLIRMSEMIGKIRVLRPNAKGAEVVLRLDVLQ